ncbi:MAG: hypothetical protein ACK53Y_06355, partial [bacterium]
MNFSSGPHPVHFTSVTSPLPFPPPTAPPLIYLWPRHMIPDYLNDTDPFYQHLLGPPDNLNVSTDEIGSLIVSG